VGPKNRRHYHKHSHGQERPADAECGEECTDGEDLVTPHCISCSPDPVGDLKVLQHEAEKIVARERHQCEHHDHDHHHASDANTSKNTSSESSDHGHNRDEENPAPASEEDQDKKRLVKMGLNTALAISVHNFPEGLATFVAAVQEPRVGALLAIAIAIHNIPEGLCIALPIYYATGSRWKGFCWALLSGLTQPFAALVGWAALATAMSDEVYGILFGITTGLMVIISVRELIPTAHRYDPLDTVTTYSFIAGMVIMALSLVLFARSGNH
jgi:ZIP family zinc transporter